MWNSVIKPVWDALGAGISWVVNNVILPIWETLKGALDLVKDAFSKAVDWIGQVWDRIKAIAARPVRFVVETVYGGIRNAWNKVAGWLNLPELPEAPLGELAHYATGGRVRGRGGPTDDKVPAMLSNGEYVVRTEAARTIGYDTLDRLNNRPRRMGESDYFHYAGGGRVQGGAVLTTDIQHAMWDAVRTAFPGAVLTSGTRFQDVGSGYDFHMAGAAIDLGGPMQQIASWIARTYPDALELFWDPGPNIDEGRPTGAIGGHSDHVHWAMNRMVASDGRLVSADVGSSGGGLFGWLRARVGDAFNAIMDPIGSAIPDFGGGAIGQVPRKAFDAFRTGVYDFLVGKSDEVEGSSVPGSGPVKDQVKQAFAPYGWDTGQPWADTDWIVGKESSWNPLARNPSSRAFGLFQFLGSTKDAYLPDENPNPFIQGQAGARYIRDRYGNPSAARRFWEANNWYDDGGIARGRGIMMKDIIRPERVLDADMTRSFDEKLIPILERLTTVSPGEVLSATERAALVSVDLSGAQVVGQHIENQYVSDDKRVAREVRQQTKRAVAEARL